MHIYQLTIYCFASFQIDRKLVKQTVMTSVYGVTYVGAREQIKRRLEEKGLITDDRLLFTAACYAAKVSNQRHQNSLIYYGTEIKRRNFLYLLHHLDIKEYSNMQIQCMVNKFSMFDL